MKKTNAVFLFAFLLIAAAITANPTSNLLIITWGGNSPEWNKELHLSGVRIGCSDAYTSCLQQVDQIARSQQVSSVFLAIPLNPVRVGTDSAAYGALGPSHPNLVEVGFDDFVGQCEKTHLDPSGLSRLLESVAANLKSRGPNLKFGATIYQDQLSSGELDRLQLSDGARQSIDLVHLFPHYRKERKPITDYIADAKRVFPNAKVILGVYAYDRREYVPCSPDNHTPCSSEEEINYFDQIFHEDLKIMSSSAAIGIEFFPGNFGGEDSWKGWNNPRACKQGEKEACVQNTVAMRDKVRDAMQSIAP